MRVVVIWRESSDYARDVIDWLENFRRRTGEELESVNPDDKVGISLVETYNAVQYPTILALSSDGILQKDWSGLPLPLIDEVAYYLRQG